MFWDVNLKNPWCYRSWICLSVDHLGFFILFRKTSTNSSSRSLSIIPSWNKFSSCLPIMLLTRLYRHLVLAPHSSMVSLILVFLADFNIVLYFFSSSWYAVHWCSSWYLCQMLILLKTHSLHHITNDVCFSVLSIIDMYIEVANNAHVCVWK